MTLHGVRFQPVNMEEDCGMCHSLAFDTSGGTLRGPDLLVSITLADAPARLEAAGG